MDKRGRVFVICHTLLHNVFRPQRSKDGEAVEGFKKWLRSKFIADFIFIMECDGQYIAYTSPKAFSEFTQKLKGNKKEEYIKFLEPIIVQIRIPPTDDLRVSDGIIVIADLLTNTNNFETILITDMKAKKVRKAKEFYKKYTGQRNPIIPFEIMDTEQAVKFLMENYKPQCIELCSLNDLYHTVLFPNVKLP